MRNIVLISSGALIDSQSRWRMTVRGESVMEFLLKAGYYGVSAVGVLVFGLFFLGNLFYTGNPTDTWVTKVVLLVSGLTGVGFMTWSVVVGHMGGQWAVGMGLAVLGMVLFAIMALVGMLMFTNVHWQ
jgi:hypothetical protein